MSKCVIFFVILIAAQVIYSAEPPARCLQPIVQGKCRAEFLSYGYNTETKKCVLFGYGGCDGNSNRFDTKGECEETCLVN